MSINIFDGSNLQRVDGVSPAKNIPYNSSELSATNVQDAIDETNEILENAIDETNKILQNSIDEINENLDRKANQDDVLTSMEEVTASTNGDDVVGSGAIKELSNSLGGKFTLGGAKYSVDIRHGISSVAISNLQPNASVSISIDISSSKYTSLVYAIASHTSGTLLINFLSTQSTNTTAVFKVTNIHPTAAYNGNIYPDVLYFGIV